MNKIQVKAYAKINLSLDVLARLKTGYHQVEMIMQQIDLYDIVTVSIDICDTNENKDFPSISLSANRNDLPLNNENLAWKAAELMQKRYLGKKEIINIHIEKNIPVAAGLAGGSSNCAAVLLALSAMWGLKLSVLELMELGAELGSDVPFCIMGQAALNKNLNMQGDPMAATCALAEGTGTAMTPVTPLDAWVLLVKPDISVPTGNVYGKLDLDSIKQRPNTKEMILGLKNNNLELIEKNMVNILEIVSLKEYPIVMYTKNNLIEKCLQKGVLMSGSGPTVFAIFQDKDKGEAVYGHFKNLYREVYFIRALQ